MVVWRLVYVTVLLTAGVQANSSDTRRSQRDLDYSETYDVYEDYEEIRGRAGDVVEIHRFKQYGLGPESRVRPRISGLLMFLAPLAALPLVTGATLTTMGAILGRRRRRRDLSVSRKMAFESLNQDNVTRSNETFTEPSGGHNQTTTTPDNSKSHHDVIGPPSNYREARRFNTPVYWGTAYRGGLQDSVFQHGGPRRQDSVFGGPRRQDSVFGGPRRQDSVFQHGGPRRQDTTDKFQDGGLDVVQRYLHQVRPDGDYRDEVMASYLECSGLLDSANRCLERLACQFSDPTAPLPTLEKDVASLIIYTLMNNRHIEEDFKRRMQLAALHGRDHPGDCRSFLCNREF